MKTAKDDGDYRILIIDDCEDDFIFLQNKLLKRIVAPTIVHAENFKKARAFLKKSNFDIILLDIRLPDKSGNELIEALRKVAKLCEIIIISDTTDMEVALDPISQGVSDYLFKGELTSMVLYKSLVYAIERKKNILRLKQSEKRYGELFHLNPQPMWVYDLETCRFLSVNEAAIRNYGYTEDEFLAMTLKDIRPEDDVPILEKAIDFVKDHKRLFTQGIYRHKRKNGEVFFVELKSNIIYMDDRKAELVLASDISERMEYISAIEAQNRRLKEIAYEQSHIVRAPLANMMGILHHIKDIGIDTQEGAELLEHFISCGNQLDSSIKEIVKKSEYYKLGYLK